MTTTTTPTDNHTPTPLPTPDVAAGIAPELAAALVAFQAEVPTIAKTRTARMGSYSYKYADLADTWDAIRKPLHKHGLAVTQPLSGGRDGWMTITTTVLHKSGHTHSESVDVDVKGRSPQEIGSQITYFKRYTLSAALGISTDEDNDASGVAASSRHNEPDEDDPALVEARREANEARRELVIKLGPLGWDRVKLTERFRDDYSQNLVSTTDANLIRKFGEVLAEETLSRRFGAELAKESQDAKRSGQPSGPAETPEPANAPEEPITQRQLTALSTALSNLGIKGHDATVQWCTEALGYEVGSKRALSRSEASTLIDKAVAIEKQQGKEPDGTSN